VARSSKGATPSLGPSVPRRQAVSDTAVIPAARERASSNASEEHRTCVTLPAAALPPAANGVLMPTQRCANLLIATAVGPMLLLIACSPATTSSNPSRAAVAADVAPDASGGGASVEPGRGEAPASGRPHLTDRGQVQITNKTQARLVIYVEPTDALDWNGPRPNQDAPEGFQESYLDPGQSVTREFRPQGQNGAPFTFHVQRSADLAATTGTFELVWKGTGHEIVSPQFQVWGLRSDIWYDCLPGRALSGPFAVQITCHTLLNPSTRIEITEPSFKE